MSRLPVSVIVTASGSPDDFRTCLESLRPTLGLRDEVVCVVPADRADLRGALSGGRWLTVLEDSSGDQARRWAAGLDATSHPVVVLLDGDVCVSAHWLEPLAEALSDPNVVAAGPRCHRSFGPQAADPPEEAMARAATFKAYARQWRQEHAGEFSDVDQLGPVCVAIRRDALVRAGGPTVDLPYEQLRTQGRILVAHGALLTHTGSDRCALHLPDVPTDAPLISASMIVKDEEDILGECLAALRNFVDEIVVYDTGSTDRTRDIAREHGARVIEGYWNDSFGDARNRALAYCTGQWILYVDADEVITGDPAALRAQAHTAGTPSLLVGVESLVGHGTGVYGRQLYPRLFRRNRARFIRRLHEQVVDRVVGLTLASPTVLDGVFLRHSGYTVLRNMIKDKGSRNLRLAELSTDDGADRHAALLGLARSQLLAVRPDSAIETCLQALADAENPHHRNFYWVLISSYEQTGNLEAARRAIAELREICNSPVTADELEARIRYRQGDYAGALAITEAFPDGAVDDDSIVVDRGRVIAVEILCLSELQRHHEAAQRLRDCIRSEQLPLPVAQMVSVLESDGGGVAELAELLPLSAVRTLLLSVDGAPDAFIDDLLEALWHRHGAAGTILAGAARVGGRLALMRAMEWSARLRQHGFAEHCTLLALAADHGRTPRDRTLAAAIALELFSDGRARPLLADALGALPAADSAAVLAELRMLAPTVAAGIEPAGVG